MPVTVPFYWLINCINKKLYYSTALIQGRIFFTILMLIYFGGTCPAQPQSFTFNNVPSPTGNRLSKAIAIVQDVQGYIWIGQKGLHRYDGYTYFSYFHDRLNPNSLADDEVEALCADHKGFIWIAAGHSGLDRLDPATGTFTHFQYKPDDNTTLSHNDVKAIMEDREGIIWVGTENGLNRFNPKSQAFTRYHHDPADATTLSCNEIRTIYEDRQGTLWIGTGSAFGENEEKEGGLNRFDRKTGTFTRYVHDPGDSKSLTDNRVRAIFEDSRGNFWIGTAGDGLHIMNRATGDFERLCYDPLHPGNLSRPSQKKIAHWVDDHVTFITEDATGAIWIGTFGNGINRYDPKTKKITYIPNFKDPKSAVQTEKAWTAISSQDGMLWIGYWEGLFLVDPLQRTIPYTETGKLVEAVFKDMSNVLWYGGEDFGLIRKDNENGTPRQYLHDANNPLTINSNKICVIYEDRQGVLWMGGDSGLARFDRKTGTFSQYKNKPGDNHSLAGNYVVSIYEDKRGSLWVGASEGGLNLMNRNTGTFTRYLNDPTDTTGISSNDISSICEDMSGNLWVGTYDAGLNHLDVETGKSRRFLHGTLIYNVMQDSDGVIWAGTNSGLYRSDAALEKFMLFNDAGIDFRENMDVTGMLEDDHKALWINTSIGICKLNQKRNKIIVYSRNPERNIYRWGKCSKSGNGQLFFGGNAGYYAFFPEQLAVNFKPPQIVINEFRVADQVITPGNRSPLNVSLAYTKEIRLNYSQNIFSFAFAGLHYSNPEENQHFFMLENLDKSWRKTGQDKTAYYYNVPAGVYNFRVKAISSYGVAIEKAITVIVDPPWWSVWWLKVIALLCIIAAGHVLMRWRFQQKFRLHLERTQNEKQLAELQQQKTELEMQALRAQMNPHFIFNSLNSINRFILQNNRTQASEYLIKFSRLIRLILQNSQATLTTLESELESIQLYLELERLRFDGHFSSEMIIEDELDTEIIKLPPLLIQPYIENAIWHGLMPKEEDGHLNIHLFIQEEMLCCKILDDGIGRKKAGTLNHQPSSIHRPMGLRITEERIAMLQQQTQIRSSVQITDLVLPDGTACGTEVLLKIPLIIN